jgi:hypothetical protein
MNVQQLSMPREQAREKLRAVRQQLHRRADSEYQQLETAYKAAAQGKPLIMLSEALRTAPLDEKGRPRLAVSRADRVQVRFQAWTGRWSWTSTARGQEFRNSQLQVLVDHTGADYRTPDGYALVPIVPPDVRGNHSLETHSILWEVEQWADRPIGARPDIDPLLLKHLGGDLYAVVAEWDLTDIERAIMAARARS